MKKYKGKFITFEGSEGSGKSTQMGMIHRYLKKQKAPILLLREPGGVKISEKVRNILLESKNKNMSDECETLLYMAARAQLVNEVILPQLKKGRVILCDRFMDSTLAYQGYGNGVSIPFIESIGKFVTQNIQPDLTLIFDIEAKQGLARINRKLDRIELRPLAYHNRVRQGYLKLAKLSPKRIKLIKVDQNKERIHKQVRGYIDRLLGIE